MNCRPNRYIFLNPPPVGNFRGQHFKVTSGFTKYLGNAAILNDYKNMLGEAGYFEDGEREGRMGGSQGGRKER